MTRYYGGKNHIFRGIINLIPEHERYVELFAGSAAVARHLARRNAEALVVELDKEQAAKLRLELPGHRVLNEDAIALLARLGPTWGRETVVFADPPYPLKDRRDTRHRYRCELDEEQHQELVRLLRATRARVLVCGHPWGLYPHAFSDWKRNEFPVILRSGKPGVEVVWTNYADPFPLHDYSFWGPNKRVRQDLHRQIQRHLGKFERMERHARAAVLRELVARFGELGQAESPARSSLEEAQAALPAKASGEDLAGDSASGRRGLRVIKVDALDLPPALEEALLGSKWSECAGCGGYHGGARCTPAGKAVSPTPAVTRNSCGALRVTCTPEGILSRT